MPRTFSINTLYFLTFGIIITPKSLEKITFLRLFRFNESVKNMLKNHKNSVGPHINISTESSPRYSLNGATMASYTYNPDGLRRTKAIVTMLTQRYIWSGDSMVYECEMLYPNNGTVYVYGINLISSRNSTGNSTFYLYNAHGDVVQLVDGTGTITKTYNYDAFGVEYDEDADDENYFRYAGQHYDTETGTYYLRARYYDPAIGRFSQQDGWGYANFGDPLSLNLYTYCSNNPIKYYDLTGHSSEERLGEGIWSLKSDVAGRSFLVWYLFGGGRDFTTNDGYFGKYMMNNSILTEKVKDMILPYGDDLSNNESIDIDIVTSMEIQNGEDIIGYQYLHGTNADADGFTIKGTISKNDKGDITYDLTYTWNDIMDPNFIYDSDSKKAQFANSIPGANPTDYKLSISWSDKTVIKANPSWFNWSSGWLSK